MSNWRNILVGICRTGADNSHHSGCVLPYTNLLSEKRAGTIITRSMDRSRTLYKLIIRVLCLAALVVLVTIVGLSGANGEGAAILPMFAPTNAPAQGGVAIPPPKYARPEAGDVTWSGKVIDPSSLADSYPVLMGRLPKTGSGVGLELVLSAKVPVGAPAQAVHALRNKEGYWLTVMRSGIRLQSDTRAGIARGLVRLASLASDSGQEGFPMGTWADWPDLSLRALHLVLNKKVQEGDLKRVVDLASDAEFNTLVVLVTPAVGLQSFKGLSRNVSITQSQFQDFVRYAHQSGLSVVPGLELLTHQEDLFGDLAPHLMYNAHTYDPRNPAVYKAVFPIMDQLLKITGAKAFLIGHDEVAGWKPSGGLSNRLTVREGERPLPADLFVKDVKTLRDHLAAQGVSTWMWGDMLLSPAQFPREQQKHLHGRLPGYGKFLWNQLPKDIVVCDWNYTDSGNDFESMQALRAAGFRVIGSTWQKPKTIRDFSRYAIDQGADGMIATLWFHLQKHQWNIVENIIAASGAAYWNASKS